MTPSPQNTVLTSSVLWLAYCSNRIRTVEDCVVKTQEILADASAEEKKLLTEWIGQQISSAAMNRGSDSAFVQTIFGIDNKALALGCVDAAFSLHSQGMTVLDMQPYLDEYASRYGEDADFLTTKLRYLTLYPHYASNVSEVERIIGVLTAPVESPAKSEVV